jgi:membrane protease YdiL (CAAX protease family)
MLKNLSPPVQLIAFILLVVILSGLGEIIFGLAISPFVPDPTQVDWLSPKMTLARTFFFQIFGFLFAFMFYLRYADAKLTDLLDIDSLKLKPFLISLVVLIGGFFAMELLQQLNEPLRYLIPEHPAIVYEDEVNALQEKLVYHNDPIQLIFSLLIMAALPAICEELVFRGFLIHNLMKSGGNVHLSVLISSLLFAVTHFQPLKFLPILFMGICLGYVYTYFKNIKYSMIIHFGINGFQIAYAYFTFKP